MDILNTYVLWAAIAVFFIVRQFMSAPIRPRSLLVVPLVMGYFGIQAIVKTPPETVLAGTVFLVNVVAGVVLGLARGASTKVWQAADGTWMRRGTLLTLVLWIVSIAARVGIGFASHGATPLDTITFFLAVTFAAQNLAVWLRIGGARTHPVVEVR